MCLLSKYHAVILMTYYKNRKQQLQQHLHLFWGNTVPVYMALQDLLVFILSEDHRQWEKYDDEISVI